MGSSRLDTTDLSGHPYKSGDEVWIDRVGRYSSIGGVEGRRPGRRAVVVSAFWEGSDPFVRVRFRDFPLERQRGTPLHFNCSRVSRVDAVTRLGELNEQR